MIRLLSSVFFLCLLVFPNAFAGEAVRPEPLSRPLKLSLWGSSLARTAQTIREQTGVEMLFYVPDLPPEVTNAGNVYLVTGNVTLGTVMEVLARLYGFRFRVTSAGRIEVSRGYNWIGDRQTLRFVRVPPLTPSGEGEQAFRDLAVEMVKPLPLLADGFSLKFETYPLPGQPEVKRGTLVLPEVMADYVARGLDCLAGRAGDFPSPGEGRGTALYARARDCGADWEGLLARRLRAPRGGTLRDILMEAAEQAGVVIAVRNPPERAGSGLPYDMERVTLGQLGEILSSGWGLGKRVLLACGGVVFEGGEAELETDARSRELFWDGLAVAGFDVVNAVARARNGEALLALLRRDVFPGVWRDPVCSMTYSAARGRVAVVAPMNVMSALAERIRELGGR